MSQWAQVWRVQHWLIEMYNVRALHGQLFCWPCPSTFMTWLSMSVHVHDLIVQLPSMSMTWVAFSILCNQVMAIIHTHTNTIQFVHFIMFVCVHLYVLQNYRITDSIPLRLSTLRYIHFWTNCLKFNRALTINHWLFSNRNEKS